MTNRNLGCFRIPARFIREQPERLAEAFKIMMCVPIRVEMLYCKDELEYIAIAELFPKVEMGMMIPEYSVKITQSKAGNVELVEILPLGRVD